MGRTKRQPIRNSNGLRSAPPEQAKAEKSIATRSPSSTTAKEQTLVSVEGVRSPLFFHAESPKSPSPQPDVVESSPDKVEQKGSQRSQEGSNEQDNLQTTATSTEESPNCNCDLCVIDRTNAMRKERAATRSNSGTVTVSAGGDILEIPYPPFFEGRVNIDCTKPGRDIGAYKRTYSVIFEKGGNTTSNQLTKPALTPTTTSKLFATGNKSPLSTPITSAPVEHTTSIARNASINTKVTPLVSRHGGITRPSSTISRPESTLNKPRRLSFNPPTLTPHPKSVNFPGFSTSSTVATPTTAQHEAPMKWVSEAALNIAALRVQESSPGLSRSPARNETAASKTPTRIPQPGRIPQSVRGVNVALRSTFGPPTKTNPNNSPQNGGSGLRYGRISAVPSPTALPRAASTANTPIRPMQTLHPGTPMSLSGIGANRSYQNREQGCPVMGMGTGTSRHIPVRSLPFGELNVVSTQNRNQGDVRAQGKRTLGEVNTPADEAFISPPKRARASETDGRNKENLNPSPPGRKYGPKGADILDTPAMSVSNSEINKENVTPRGIEAATRLEPIPGRARAIMNNEALAIEESKCLFMMNELDRKIHSFKNGIDQANYMMGLLEIKLRAVRRAATVSGSLDV